MSNSCNQTLTLLNPAEIMENKRPTKLSPLLLSRNVCNSNGIGK